MSIVRNLPAPVIRDLARLVESESLGEAFFAAAANRSSGAASRRAWEALRDLEIQTNTRLREFLERAEVDVSRTNRVAGLAGTAGGASALVLPDAVLLRIVRQGTGRYLPAFRRLADYFRRSDDGAFFDYVVQHELAIIDYTGGALSGSRAALDPVLRLLEQHPDPAPGSEAPSQERGQ